MFYHLRPLYQFQITTILLLFIPFNSALAQTKAQELLSQFHKMGITHCDEFISKNVVAEGSWKFFLGKHANGIDGPSTEVSLVQISGVPGKTYKTDYSFIQTLKKCFLHKKGQITEQQPCEKAVNKSIWNLQFNLPGYDYKRYKDSRGVILYAKDLPNQQCLLEYEFRTMGNHSIYKPK